MGGDGRGSEGMDVDDGSGRATVSRRREWIGDLVAKSIRGVKRRREKEVNKNRQERRGRGRRGRGRGREKKREGSQSQ